MINNLEDLHNLIFNEWEIPFCKLENIDLISESNSKLLNYAKNFGSSIPKNNHQDHLQIIRNLTNSDLTDFIIENSGNWTIAVHKKTRELYTNEHWAYTECDISDYRKLNFEIEECLISYSLQEMYFAFCNNNLKVEPELNFKPIWIDKRYSSNDKTHNFYYDAEFKALKYIDNGGLFTKIAFIRL